MNLDGRLRPSPAEENALRQRVERLVKAVQQAADAQGLGGQATVQGSVAKGTWLAGATDVDLFVLYPADVPLDRLEAAATDIAQGILQDARKKYAQHPYVLGSFEGLDVDLVPAFDVPPGERMSAVDRTPHHTAWVKEHLKDAMEVRKAKQWCKGVGIYGADTASAGFSGYLVEVLVILLGGFDAFIDWLAGGPAKHRLAAGADRVDDDVSPLVVVDPVDPTRNCAAAVGNDTLALAVEAALAYRHSPAERFFFPPPPAAASSKQLAAALRRQGATWVGLEMRPRTDRLDIVLPQFQKAGRQIGDALTRAGFPVRRVDVQEADDVLMQWITDDVTLAAKRRHAGPPPGGPDADRFRQKWEDHPDAAGPVREAGGHLVVEVHVHARTPAAWLQENMPRLQVGKHVRAALKDAKVLEAPEGRFAAPISTFILQQRPWQRA